jgi:ribosomal protein S4E
MKLIKIFLNYIKSKYSKQKTLQLSDIETNLKFSKGDRVIITHYKHKRIEGEVVKITYSKCKTNSKYFVLYKVEFTSGPQDEIIKYDFSDYELEHINKDKERDWKLKQVLN